MTAIVCMEKRPDAGEKGREMRRARVCWRSLATGAEGHGDWIDERTAQAWLDHANAECVGLPITHWLEYETNPTPGPRK